MFSNVLQINSYNKLPHKSHFNEVSTLLNKIYQHLCLIALVIFSCNAQALNIGDKAPDFTLKSTLGKNLNLKEQQGNIILINFWASWCGPCRKEMPALQVLQEKYQDLGFSVWGINVEQENQAGKRFLADLKLTFPIFFDAKNTLSATYQVAAMPTSVIIDRNGIVRFIFRGYKSGYENKYAKAIKQLIRE